MRRSFIPVLFILALGLAIWLGLDAGDPAILKVKSAVIDHPIVLGPSETAFQPQEMKLPTLTALSSGTEAAVIASASVTPVTQPSGPELIEQWLSSSTDIPTIAKNMLAGFASLNAEDHLLAASKLVALVGDDRYAGLQRIILDPKTSEEAKQFLFRDAVNRSSVAKLPLMLAIMQQRDHPCAAEAREALKAQLGNDYGLNYVLWQTRIQEELKRQ